MQTQKGDIRHTVLERARLIFLHKGYRKASMRDIASASGVGLSNIYNYFQGKDALFRELVRPALSVFEQMLDEHHGRRGKDIREMYSSDYFRAVVQEYVGLLVRHRIALELLFFHSQGSSLENYRQDYADRATETFKEYLLAMKRKHPGLNIDISDFSIRLHNVWMFTLLEEVLRQKIKPKETERIISEYITGEIFGWSELMKL